MRAFGQSLTIGERVAWYRRRRGMSQEVLAGLVGRTVDWLSKVENNRIDLDRLSVIRVLAETLDVSIGDLVGEPSLLDWPEHATSGATVPALRSALLDYRQLSPFLAGCQAEPRDIEAIHRDLWAVWDAYQSSRYSYVVGRLPALIRDTQDAASAGDGADQEQAVLDEVEDEIRAAFRNDVRAEAAATRFRLALEPPPERSPTGVRLAHNDEDQAEDVTYDISLEANNTCEQFVTAILDSDEPDLPRQIIESLSELPDDESGLAGAHLIAHGVGYLVTMKDKGITAEQLDAAVDWIGRRFGAGYAGPAAIVAGLAGHHVGQRILADQLGVTEATFDQLAEFLNTDLFPAMIWLCTGLVATSGAGDVSWLRQYRV